MSTEVKFRRGSTTQHATFTGAQGEVTVDTDLNTLRVHDGATVGGHRILLHSEFVGTGTGTVTQIDTGAGLTGGPITASGTVALTTDTQTTLTNAQTAYSWGNHQSFNYLTNISGQILTNLNDVNSGATDGQILHWVSSANQWQPVDKPSGGGGGGAGDFLTLSDTPSVFTSQALKYLRVNTAENALEFVENLAEENAASNRGAGEGLVFYAKDNSTAALQFRSIRGGANITVSQTNDEITVDAAAIAYYAGTGLDIDTNTNTFSLESGYVKDTGNFTLAGDLTFSGSLIFQNTLSFGNTLTIDRPGTTDKEIFVRGKLSDAANDYIEMSNASTSTSSLAPAFRGGVESNAAIPSVSIIAETPTAKDTGTTPLMQFTVRRGSDLDDYAYGTPATIQTRPLYAFENQGNVRFQINSTFAQFNSPITVSGDVTVPHNILFKNSFSLKSGLESAIPAGTYPGCVGVANNELYFSATSNSGEWLRVAKATEVPTGVFNSIEADSGGSHTATTVTEKIIFAGGSGVNTSLDSSTNTITISATGGGGGGGGGNQDIWATITADTGSATANSTVDALTVSGGTGITTSITGDVLTISQDASNLFKNIAVSGQTNIVASGVDDTLEFVAGDNITIVTDSTAKTVRINSTASGGGGSSTNAFGTISVANNADIVADQAPDTLTFVAGTGINISTSASADEITITNSANASTAFTTIAVSGETNVVADTPTDTLTFEAGSNVTLTTDAANDKVVISAAATSQDTYKNIAVAGQSTISAGDPADTLTLVAGTGITIATSATNDSVTITNSLPDTSDIQYDSRTFAARTFKVSTPVYNYVIEDITLDTSTMQKLDGSTAVSPTIYLIAGHTYCFDLNTPSHPFRIKSAAGEGQTGSTNDYSTGLKFWNASSQQWFTGANAQGQTDNLVFWTVPQTISGNYIYQCGSHSGMNGVIKIVDITALFPMGAATSGAAGTAGYMTAPAAGDEAKVFKGDATWQTDNVT